MGDYDEWASREFEAFVDRELERQLDALRRRNEKLERVAALARKLPGRRVGQTPYIVLLNEILVALRELDKEDA